MTLTDLFEPTAIAVVGASRTAGKMGNDAMQNAVEYGGRVYPVNPSAEGEFMGEQFHASVADIDDDVDLALLCVPPHVAVDVVAECGEAGVGAAIVYAGGFAEAGEQGEALQDALIEAAAEGDVTLLGPNVSGFVFPERDLYASFAPGVTDVGEGEVTVVAQSGGVAHSLAFQLEREGRGVRAMVGLGNRANTGFEEVVDYFDADAGTGAIVLHVEGVDDARSLLETCEAAETPIVAYNVGQEDVGGFAESHTGALTGDYDLYEAGFRQYGVPTADSTTNLHDAGHALAHGPEPDGPNVGVVTAQAGPGIIVSDRLQAGGAVLPTLDEATQETVEGILPGITYSSNPVDTGRPMPEFGDLVAAVARDDNVDIVLIYMLFEESLGFPVEDLDGLAAEVDKPILLATDGVESDMAGPLAALEDAGVATFRTPERGADATSRLVEYARVNDGGGRAATDGGGEAPADGGDAADDPGSAATDGGADR